MLEHQLNTSSHYDLPLYLVREALHIGIEASINIIKPMQYRQVQSLIEITILYVPKPVKMLSFLWTYISIFYVKLSCRDAEFCIRNPTVGIKHEKVAMFDAFVECVTGMLC